MDFILYFFVFLIGITFGSFFTLAVYRIPLGKDITHTRSYCPNCNHKLAFIDLIPVFSYIFLGGKCRYCKKKIRARYLLLELLTGVAFVLFAMSVNVKVLELNTSILIYLATGFLYLAGLFIIAGIDKERFEIRNEVLLYVVIVEALYIIYLYIVEKANIYRYVIYLFAMVVFIVANNLYFSKKAKNNYTFECLILVLAMLTFTYETCTILTIMCTLIAIAINIVMYLIKNKSKKYVKNNKRILKEYNIPIGYYLCVSNIIMLIATNFIIFNQLV